MTANHKLRFNGSFFRICSGGADWLSLSGATDVDSDGGFGWLFMSAGWPGESLGTIQSSFWACGFKYLTYLNHLKNIKKRPNGKGFKRAVTRLLFLGKYAWLRWTFVVGKKTGCFAPGNKRNDLSTVCFCSSPPPAENFISSRPMCGMVVDPRKNKSQGASFDMVVRCKSLKTGLLL